MSYASSLIVEADLVHFAICLVPDLSCALLSSPLPLPFFRRLQKVVRLVLDPQVPCVTITGERGSGKTEMAVQACDYMRDRHHFDSFLWADARKAVAKAEAGKNGVSSHFALSSPGISGALGLQVSGDSTLDPCRLVREETA